MDVNNAPSESKRRVIYLFRMKIIGIFTGFIIRDPAISMKCITKRKKYRKNFMITYLEKNGLMPLLSLSGRNLVTNDSAVWAVSKQEIQILDQPVFAECLQKTETKTKKFNAKNVDVGVVPVAIDNYIFLMIFKCFKYQNLIVVFSTIEGA